MIVGLVRSCLRCLGICGRSPSSITFSTQQFFHQDRSVIIGFGSQVPEFVSDFTGFVG